MARVIYYILFSLALLANLNLAAIADEYSLSTDQYFNPSSYNSSVDSKLDITPFKMATTLKIYNNASTYRGMSAVAIKEKLYVVNLCEMFSIDTNGNKNIITPYLCCVPNKQWIPTGIAYAPDTDEVFIANYIGNNILQGKIKDNKFIASKSITSPQLISPENVSVTADARFLVSGNYDGNTVTAFVRDEDGEWSPLWSTPIDLAHGVAIAGNKVYATSLQERKIYVLDRHTGKIVCSMGKLGWNAANGEFLWPVSIVSKDENNILVVDAHTGGIYDVFYDAVASTLKIRGVYGGNRPELWGLAYPYGLAFWQDRLAVLSTYKNNILMVNPVTWTVEDIYANSNNLASIPELWVARPEFMLGMAWDAYIDNSVSYEILGRKVFAGYGKFVDINNGQTSLDLLRFPTNMDFFINYSFFIQPHFLNQQLIISATSDQVLMVVRPHGVAFINLPGISLKSGEGFIGSNKLYSWPEISLHATEIFTRQRQARHKNGYLAWKDFRSFSLDGAGDEQLNITEAIITSKGGKTLFEDLKINGSTWSKEQLEHMWKHYLSQHDNRAINLPEALILGTLCGQTDLIGKQYLVITPNITAATKTYEGHGFGNSLDGDPYNNYSAALENQDEYFISLDFDSEISLSEIQISWNDNNDFAEYITIYESDQYGNKLELISTIRRKNNALFFEDLKPRRYLRLDFAGFHGQQRLLLRQLIFLKQTEN